jgi:hypothetical protein
MTGSRALEMYQKSQFAGKSILSGFHSKKCANLPESRFLVRSCIEHKAGCQPARQNTLFILMIWFFGLMN